MAVYHQFDVTLQESVWILLQPSESVKSRLHAALQASRQTKEGRGANAFVELHLFYFMSTERRWREYITDLESELNKLVSYDISGSFMSTHCSSQDEKALFSIVGRSCKFDYSVGFGDCQDLQYLRRKLLNVENALNVGLESVGGYKSYYRDLIAKGIAYDDSDIRLQIDQYRGRTLGYKRAIRKLLERAQGTSDLVRINLITSPKEACCL